MKYTVIWKPSASADLATIWTDATDRSAVAQAAQAIDRELAVNPIAAGESRAGNDRIVFAPPLAAFVEILEMDRIVNVMHIRRLPMHS